MSASDKAASYTTKTIYGIKNEMRSFIEVPFEPDLEMTLNSKYNVFSDVSPSKVPTLKYFGIGIKGCFNVDDENLSQAYLPKETDADLYEPIPFRCVPLNEDLSADERKQYRMRVRLSVSGVDYWAYYLKLISIVDNTIQVTKVDPVSKLETPYVMNPENLFPIPQKPDTSGVITGSVSEVNVSVKTLLEVTGQEVIESIGVLYGGDLRYAKISEFGIYTGEDRQLQGYSWDNTPFTYTEAVYTQMACHHCSIGDNLSHISSRIDKYLSVGAGSVILI